jgi:hypothetical protein
MSTTTTTNAPKTNHTMADAPPTISLGEAIKRAEYWRKQVSSLPSGNTVSGVIDPPLIPLQLIFRAININMSDIDWLREQHPKTNSIRLYLSVPNPDFPLQICGMLVPVDAQNQDMLTHDIPVGTTDEDILNSTTTSTIYDFTQPCPTMCNTQSPLFNSSNSVIPYLRYQK